MPQGAANDAFLAHVPHFLLWILIVLMITGVGTACANVLNLRPPKQYLAAVFSGLIGMAVASAVMA